MCQITLHITTHMFPDEPGCVDCSPFLQDDVRIEASDAGMPICMQGYERGSFDLSLLMDVVNHYNRLLHLGLTAQEKHDVIEYRKSLPED